jgi:hypothetical protein
MFTVCFFPLKLVWNRTLQQIKSAVVLRMLEPSYRLTGMSSASFDQDMIKGWNRDLDLAIERFHVSQYLFLIPG